MNKTQKSALIWITTLLKKYQIPFQLTGGFAARVYGASRPLADIDIDIPNDKFEIIKKDVSEFVTYGPEHFKSDKWDLLLMTLNYQGQEIDLSGIDHTKIFDDKRGLWVELSGNLSQATICNIDELILPVIPKSNLIAYKKILARPEDIVDVNEMGCKNKNYNRIHDS